MCSRCGRGRARGAARSHRGPTSVGLRRGEGGRAERPCRHRVAAKEKERAQALCPLFFCGGLSIPVKSVHVSTFAARQIDDCDSAHATCKIETTQLLSGLTSMSHVYDCHVCSAQVPPQTSHPRSRAKASPCPPAPPHVSARRTGQRCCRHRTPLKRASRPAATAAPVTSMLLPTLLLSARGGSTPRPPLG